MNLELAERLPGKARDDYVAVSKTLESDGWRILRDELVRRFKIAERQKLNADNWDANRIAHGALYALSNFITYADMIDDVYREFAEGDE